MSLSALHCTVLTELAWAGFGSLRLRLGMEGGQGSGWGPAVWLLGAAAIPAAAGLLALRRRVRRAHGWPVERS